MSSTDKFFFNGFMIKKIINNFIRAFFDLYNFIFMSKYKNTSLQSALYYSSKNILFYKGKGDKLENFTFTDKSTIQNNINKFPIKKLFTNVGSTSGTTGSPAHFYRDIKNMASEQYFLNEYFQWKGKQKVWLRGDEVFPFGSNPTKPFIKIPFFGDIYISSYHLNDKTLSIVANALKNKKNLALWAYPGSAVLLAEYCLRKNIDICFDVVATSSEKLYEHQAKIIEKAFKVKVKDLYGQGERIAAFYRCEVGHYHEIPGYSYVEYLNIKNDLYNISGTSLHNNVMPLVRYKMNDIFRVDDELCKCGATSKNIIEILGREDDYITIQNKRVPGILFAAPFQRLRNIKETQIIQRSHTNIDVLVVKNEDFNVDDKKLLERTIYGILNQKYCSISYVQFLEKDKSGKLRFIINNTIHKPSSNETVK